MAVYDAERFVERSVRSVLGQTYTDFELVCVDDGSADGSLAVLKRLAAADPRVRVLANPHEGPCAALNAGMDAATGELIAFLDNDDGFHPRTLEIAAEAMDKGGFDVVAWDRTDVEDDGSGEFTFGELPKTFEPEKIVDYIGWGMGDHHIAFWCKLYRRNAVRNARFEPSIVYGDLLFYWRVFSNRNLSVGHLPLKLHRYSVRNGSTMHSAMSERKAVDKLRALSFIREYVSDDAKLWMRLRRDYFPQRLWSAYKVSRRQPELRNAIFAEIRKLVADKTVAWSDLPLVRRLKMRLAVAFRGRGERRGQ